MDTNLIGQTYNTALQNIASQMGISLNLLQIHLGYDTVDYHSDA